MSVPLLQIVQLSKSFFKQVVLDGLSLTIDRGETVVIIGQSGTGKSVFLKHLMRLMEPDKGQILIEGIDVSTLETEELMAMRQRFGMLFQGAALFDSLTVEENVGLGLKESRRFNKSQLQEIVMAKLDLVGMASAAKKYPAELSGGMRKRVGLARAIAHDPEILLYDEPTTGLDPITSDMINDLIVRINEKLHTTSIAVTHDLTSAYAIAHRFVMLYQGKAEFDGSPDELRNTTNPVVRQFIEGKATGPIQIH